MKVLDFLNPGSINIDLKGTTKQDVINELCGVLQAQGQIKDSGVVAGALLEREKLGSTGIGQGIAIPHGKSGGVDKITAALGVCKRGINFESLDGEPVYVVFVLVAPADSAGNHLQALARISRLLKDKFFRQALREAKSSEEVLKIIKEEDEY